LGAAIAIPSAAASENGAELKASCADWTPHVSVANAKVHTSFKGWIWNDYAEVAEWN